MLLVTGPTGSGKTTTLYAAISETQTGRDKIVTIEDPVEYQLPGVLQIPVNEKKGPDVRPRASLDPPPRPRQDHGRRNTRPRNRADRDPVRADRPPGIYDRPRQQRVRRRQPLRAHGRRHLQLRVRAVRRAGPAPDPHRSAISAPSGYVPSRELLEKSRLSPVVSPRPTSSAGAGAAPLSRHRLPWPQGDRELLVMTDEIREAIIARAPVRQLKELSAALGRAAAALGRARSGAARQKPRSRRSTRVTVMA